MMSRVKITGAILVVIIPTAIFLFFGPARSIEITNKKSGASISDNLPKSGLSGLACEKIDRRPIAVMLSSDPEARPLAGLSQADMVFEMPVTPGGITRMMAVYQCELPDELGSIRSARLDFIPLAQGLDAIYAHWGGEREALTQLDSGAIDNIDGLKYENKYYYRKNSRPRPHNGFTSNKLIEKAISDFDYDFSANPATSYGHEQESKSTGTIEPPRLYGGNYEVYWEYDSLKNEYLRFRGGREEMDANIKSQISSQNIVLIKTTWSPID